MTGSSVGRADDSPTSFAWPTKLDDWRSEVRRESRLSANRLNRHFEELDRRATLARAGDHGVECLVAAAHRFLALKERDAEALPILTVDEHQHLRALEAGGRVPGFDLGTNHLDRLVDAGGVALECRNACVHVASLIGVGRGPAYADSSPWLKGRGGARSAIARAGFACGHPKGASWVAEVLPVGAPHRRTLGRRTDSADSGWNAGGHVDVHDSNKADLAPPGRLREAEVRCRAPRSARRARRRVAGRTRSRSPPPAR